MDFNDLHFFFVRSSCIFICKMCSLLKCNPVLTYLGPAQGYEDAGAESHGAGGGGHTQ